MVYELLVRIIAQDGSVQSFTCANTEEQMESTRACARLCPESCSLWNVRDNVWCVVYINGRNV